MVQATVQGTEIDESDEGSLIKAPPRDIAHSRIHGVVQAVLQGDEEEEEEEEEEWISVSLPTSIPIPKEELEEEDKREEDPHLHNAETIRRWIERMTTATETEQENHQSCTCHEAITHVGNDETVVRDMLAMLSRLEAQSRELETKMESCGGGFMYSDPWVIREREETELRERVVFLLRRVLYAPVLEDDVDR